MAVAIVFLFAIPRASADSVTFQGSSGSLAAQVQFDLNTTTQVLTVTLSNTSTVAVVQDPSSLLTAVFWTSTPAYTGTLTDVELAPGSVIVPSTDTAGQAGLFGYGNNLGVNAYSTIFNYGVSAAGFNYPYDQLMTIGGVPNLSGSSSPDGVPGSLIPIANGSNPGVPTNGTNPQTPEIENALVFTISGVNLGTTTLAQAFQNVEFQYGASTSDANFLGGQVTGGDAPAPLPSSLATSSAVLLLFGAWLAKKRWANAG
jgi:hypothetical protein